MRSTVARLGAFGGLALVAASAAAAPVAEHAVVVPTFSDVCLRGPLTIAAREAAIAADGGWTADATPDVNVPALALSKAIERNFDYSKPESVRQWSRMVDGVRVRAVLATFPARQRYPALCAVIVPGVRNAMPYGDAFEAAAKAAGLKGKSTDLPHYYEYSGKPDGAHPVRAEIFSRSTAVSDRDSMHLYVAF